VLPPIHAPHRVRYEGDTDHPDHPHEDLPGVYPRGSEQDRVLGRIHQAALQTWRTYLQVSAEAFNTQGLSISTPESVKALDAVATGNGKTNIFAVVAARRKAGTFSVGRMIVTSASVQVHGNTAVISACADDQSYEVDQTGKTVTPAPGAQAFTSTLVRTARAWKVTDSKLGGLTCPAAS
jgi:hypothetical protein